MRSPPLSSFLSLQQQRRQQDKRIAWMLALLLLVAFVLALSGGDVWIWPNHWLDETAKLFVGQLRLPRSIAVVLVGAGLACSGTVMQAIFNNPLAEPGLLGVANGAGVALVLATLLGQGMVSFWLVSLSAIIGALVIIVLLLLLTIHYKMSNARLLLVGVALGVICSSIMSWAVYFSSDLDIRQLLYWLMGGFSNVSWQHLWLLLLLLPVVIWFTLQGQVLNRLSLGEQQARQLGLPITYWRNLFILLVGVVVGLSVAIAGVISFVGFIIPHMLRLSGVTDHRGLLLNSALAGGTILLLADLLARTAIGAMELPIGIVTATLGVPLFIWILLRRPDIQ